MKDAMKSSLLKHLPPRPETPKLTLIQARVESNLHQEIKKYLNKNSLNWNEFITACLKWFQENEMKK